MKIPTQRQFETAKMIHQVKEPAHVLNKLDYEAFHSLYKVINDPKRHWQVACASNVDHTILVTRRGYVIENALTGAEEDGDMDMDSMDCNDCGNNNSVVDEYNLDDYIEVAKEK